MSTKVELSLPTMAITGTAMAIVTLLAFKDDVLPDVIRRYGFAVFRTPAIAQLTAATLWLAHVYEAKVVYVLSQKKGLPQKSVWFYTGLGFIFGFPVIKGVKAVKKASSR
eukprot:jgi/Botrbrau1/13206/Bobra.0351s0016.1